MRNNSSEPEPGSETLPESPAIRFPPPLYFVAGFLIGLALERVVPLPSATPLPARIAGAVLIGASALLAGSAVYRFRRARTSVLPHRPASAFVAQGPYRFTRNPMYVGMSLLYLGIAVLTGAAWAILLLPLVVFTVDRRVIRREEAYLERRFGPDYVRYKRQVRRWV
jgi:protein-S-isoprenylcysteine O-methyltransferase Ste14